MQTCLLMIHLKPMLIHLFQVFSRIIFSFTFACCSETSFMRLNQNDQNEELKATKMLRRAEESGILITHCHFFFC